jgi:NADPH:quinone reductase-like Zn-dependent oxidoreductase
MLRLLRKVGGLIRDGLFRTDIAATYALDQIKDAVTAAETPGRQGKVLLKMG